MLRITDFNEYSKIKRVFLGSRIEKLKLNNFLTRINLKVMAEDDCLCFLDDSMLGLWGEGVLITKNFLVYNVLGESGYIPLFSISNIEFVGSDVVINKCLVLTFRKIPLNVIFDVFRTIYSCLKRNDVCFLDISNHVSGSGIIKNCSLEDEVVKFFFFVKANVNKEKIVELMGGDSFSSKENIRDFIAADENLSRLSTALVEFSGLEGDECKRTIEFFYMAFRYYSSFFYDELNYYKDDLARDEARELEKLRKEESVRSNAYVDEKSKIKSQDFCTFINTFAIQGEPTSKFIDDFLSVINGYSRKYRMNEMDYWFTFLAHLDFYFYTLANKEVLQVSGLNQVFLAPFIFLLEGNKDRVQELSMLMNDEVINDSMVSIMFLMANQRSGNKEGNFNFLYEKLSLSEKGISEEEFMRSLNVVKEKTERFVFETLRPDIERASGINKLF